MKIFTTRFGVLSIGADEVIHFPAGIVGLSACRQWVLLGDGANPSLAWLQSLTHPDVALAVVNPRRFVPRYTLRVTSKAIAPLGLDDPRQALVLVVLARHDYEITLNLKAPLVINAKARRGLQVVTHDDQPLQHLVGRSLQRWRQSA